MIRSVYEELQDPKSFVKRADGIWFADFARDAFARLEIEYDAAPDAGEWTLRFGQKLDAEGHIDLEPGGWLVVREMKWSPKAGHAKMFMEIPQHESPYQKEYQRSKVIAPEVGRGGEVAPFRYAELSGKGILKAKLTRHAMFGPFDLDAANFACPDDRLNRIWDFCKYSIRATSCFGVYIDGDRERQAFEGDTLVNALGAYCTGGGYEIARRTISFLLNYYPEPCLEYRMMMPRVILDYIRYSGDTTMYGYWRDMLHERLELFEQFQLEDGLIYHVFGDEVKGYALGKIYEYLPLFPLNLQLLIDWPEVERDNYQYGTCNFMANVYLYDSLNCLSKLEPEAGYQAQAAKLRKTIRAKFLAKNGDFLDSADSNHMALHTAVAAIFFGIAEPEEYAHLLEYIRSKGMACSVYFSQYLLETCFANGASDYAFKLLTSDGPRSWLNMLAQGSTVSMEAWSMECKPNQDWNHAWGAAPANLIPRALCGIRPIEAGFRKFIVDPKCEVLPEFQLKHPTPHGAILLEMDKKAGKLIVPEGTSAEYRGKILLPGTHTISC